MPRVLAIEPNYDVGSTLRRTLDVYGDEVLVVDSKTAALESIRQEVPDLILMSALLSPTDEDDLFDCLKSLRGAEHVQTLNIPQFRSTPGAPSKSKFSFLRGRRVAAAGGCDPAQFANEVSDYLERAATLRGELETYASPSPEAVQAPDGVDDRPELDNPVASTPVATPVASTPVATPVAADDAVDSGDSPSIFLSQDVEPATEAPDSDLSEPSIFLAKDEPSSDRSDPSDSQTDTIKEIRREAEAQAKAAESLAAELARVKEQTEQQVADELAAAQSEADERQRVELARVREGNRTRLRSRARACAL